MLRVLGAWRWVLGAEALALWGRKFRRLFVQSWENIAPLIEKPPRLQVAFRAGTASAYAVQSRPEEVSIKPGTIQMTPQSTTCKSKVTTEVVRHCRRFTALLLVTASVLVAPATSNADESPRSGQFAVDGGVTYYDVGYLGPIEQMRDGVQPTVGMQVGATWNLGRFGALTGRSGLWVTEAAVGIPTMAGISGQLPLGRTTFSAGIEVGSNQVAQTYDGFSGFVAYPTLGARAGVDYTFDVGLKLGVDVGAEGILFSGISARRATVTAGWQFE